MVARVLIVEDNAALQKIYVTLLTKEELLRLPTWGG